LVSPTCSGIRIAEPSIGCPEPDPANAMLGGESILEKITAGLIPIEARLTVNTIEPWPGGGTGAEIAAILLNLRLNLQAPEGRVRLGQLKAYVPRFVIAPDHFGFGFAATLRMDQPHLSVEGQVRTDHGHASRMANIHSDGMSLMRGCAFFPFHEEFHLGDNALVAA
jgi:hypothetical protein